MHLVRLPDAKRKTTDLGSTFYYRSNTGTQRWIVGACICCRPSWKGSNAVPSSPIPPFMTRTFPHHPHQSIPAAPPTPFHPHLFSFALHGPLPFSFFSTESSPLKPLSFLIRPQRKSPVSPLSLSLFTPLIVLPYTRIGTLRRRGVSSVRC